MSIGICAFVCAGIGEEDLRVHVVVCGGDVVARYLHSVGPSRGNDLGAITLVVWRGDRRRQIFRGGNIRMRGGGSGKMRDICWCGI